jgi:hypothetical protein
MANTAELFVWVRRQWNDWRQAKYRLDALEKPHWTKVSGGVNAPAPQFFIHAYVWCSDAIEGEVAHSGRHSPCPHRIKVCVTKKGNDPSAFAFLANMAGPKPK